MKSPEDPASADEALDRYWLHRSLPGHYPDYSGFHDWVTRRLDTIRSGVPLPFHSGASSYSRLPLELVRPRRQSCRNRNHARRCKTRSEAVRKVGRQAKRLRLDKGAIYNQTIGVFMTYDEMYEQIAQQVAIWKEDVQ